MRDSEFLRGENPMTKREVRAVALDFLELRGAKRFLDIGAGTGSVCIQAKLDFPHIEVVAVEKTETGIDLIQKNMHKHGAELTLIHDTLPSDILGNEYFDRIFFGGSSDLESVLEWAKLRASNGSIFVFNVVTVENLNKLFTLLREDCFSELEVIQISISELQNLGKLHHFVPKNPVMLFKVVYK